MTIEELRREIRQIRADRSRAIELSKELEARDAIIDYNIMMGNIEDPTANEENNNNA